MNVLIADDHDLVRDSLKAYIERLAPDIAVSACRDLDQAMAVIEEHQPFDVIVLDLRMPGMHGFDGLAKIRGVRPDTPVVIMSGASDPQTVRDALDRGARGFFPKTMNGNALVSALRLVVAGETFIPSAYLRSTGGGATNGHGANAPSPGGVVFTRREQDVLRHLLQGRANKEIAAELGLEEVTIKLHVRGICRKLGARNRTEAVAIAHQRGLAA